MGETLMFVSRRTTTRKGEDALRKLMLLMAVCLVMAVAASPAMAQQNDGCPGI